MNTPIQKGKDFDSLPKDPDLEAVEPLEVETEDERLKRLEREGDINRLPPQPTPDDGQKGVGDTTLQSVNQGQSLPAVAVGIKEDKKIDQSTIYDPLEAERQTAQRTRAQSGAKKTDI
jgi:hypothetical protein